MPQTSAARPPLSGAMAVHDPARGILLMLLAVFFFCVMDATVKFISASVPLTQIVWARYLFNFLLMLPLIPRLGVRRVLKVERPGMQILRGVLLVLITGALFAALKHIPLADAYAIGFTTPLLVTALSIPLLGEHVGWRRWLAIAVGFLGVLVVLRPGAATVHWASLLMLLMAFLFALYQIITRILSRSTSAGPFITQLYTAATGTVLLSFVVPFDWTTPDLSQWMWLIWIGFVGGVGHTIMVQAFAHAEASTLSPFTYTQLLWGVLFGYLLWGDLPDTATLIGAAVIIGSGLYIFHRESRERAKAVV